MRMTDPAKWDDEWFLDLKPLEKLLWLYMCERCDIAGFYKIPKRKASFELGVSIEEYLGAYEGLMRGYLGAKNKEHIWLRNFLKYQKNLPLNKWNNAHKSILNKLYSEFENYKHYKEFTLLPIQHLERKGDKSSKLIESNLGANKPLMRGTGKGKGKGKGNCNCKDKDLFESTWIAFGKYGTKPTAWEYWQKLTDEDIATIIERIPIYLNHLTRTGYSKKMFQGWINPKNREFETTYENSQPQPQQEEQQGLSR